MTDSVETVTTTAPTPDPIVHASVAANAVAKQAPVTVAATAAEIEQSVRDHLVSTAQWLHTKLGDLEASPELARAKAALESAIHNISAHFAAKAA